ncbi:bifunctional alpha,alpha-trehalose-phosphate synthase (UDP-forming)/trehalose-phosphatase [Alkalispirochaeta alkalica]|uniref:bifunctional alpha,alpha-trehalose-phosphate synthase (UDP-forming)/trehalose-phosphatase n=1 Tax=Alkalispirochaeta alkalica TaxID=46356 RepID=UPI0004760A1A|nr:bifunctional alpha,alpha-trehalose-phosphate synthase (UDP-forming)/trehalose-phosphatase [Alkalispirochaeta alkalica]
MNQTIFVSNRLTVSVQKEEGELRLVPSVGGLATGLSSVSTGGRPPLWVGWSGIARDDLPQKEYRRIQEQLRQDHNAIEVPLSQEDLDLFYSGFCNDTIWPLFHYFPTYTEYVSKTWKAYQDINQRFFDVLAQVMEEDATVWVHDYQLMLLPGLIKKEFPHAQVGFFLHIPFPSFEMFRLLPSREAILEGLLGADLIGFHTYDYARHFLSSVRRLLGFDHSMGIIRTRNRAVKVDVFPMGIDWERFLSAGELPAVKDVRGMIDPRYAGQKLILSVDRLDYSKGIPTRIRAFRRLLEEYPQYIGVVTLLIIVSPSRESVPRYMELKREVDELVSDINGRMSTLNWVPIHYQYQTASFEELSALYRRADVLLVTPLRDGMNLIAKEYLAARTDEQGVLVLSETAGVARELSEAILVNPSDLDGIASAIKTALEQPREEQNQNMRAMRNRLQRLTVQYWAQEFLDKLAEMQQLQAEHRATPMDDAALEQLCKRWKQSGTALLLLDYDGTLMRFRSKPHQAKPDEDLLRLIADVNRLPGVQVVISSGRDRANLQAWFPDDSLALGAGHGAWIRDPGKEWQAAMVQVPEWKVMITPIMQRMVDRTPGSFLEEKDFSLAWHYRNSEPELANVRLAELRETLISLTNNLELSVLDGNRVLEVKPANVHKGRVVHHFAEQGPWDLIIAVGDDATDEHMFTALPEGAVSIKVGVGATDALYSIDGVEEVHRLLRRLLATTV